MGFVKGCAQIRGVHKYEAQGEVFIKWVFVEGCAQIRWALAG